LKSNNLSVVHSGDNLTGEGDGDDELITVNLSKIPDHVDSIWPVVTIYTSGKNFSQVKGTYCRIFEGKKSEFCKYMLYHNNDGVSNGCIVGNFKRNGGGWTFKALGYYTSGTKTPQSMSHYVK
jgi:tellurium resistance protein TerZ